MPTTQFRIGDSNAYAGAVGTAYVTTTEVDTGANTTETDLFSYTIPANAISGAADVLEIFVAGAFAADDNAKTLRVKLQTGAGPTFATVATLNEGLLAGGAHLNGFGWQGTIRIFGTPTSAFVSSQIVLSTSGAVIAPLLGDFGDMQTVDGTANMIVKVTGQNGTAAAADIIFVIGYVKYLSSPS